MNTLTSDAGGQPALGESRLRVLTLLQDSRRPLGVADVAASTGLHTNTARFHLDGLVDAGLVDRTTEARDQPGRPRALYIARPGSARGGQRSYRLLAEILTDYLASHTAQPAKEALQAGLRWGRQFATTPNGRRSTGGQPAHRRQIGEAAATRQLVEMLDDVGFVPQAKTVQHQRQILLHHCPFREAAIEHQDVVCAVHLGLMRGVLAEIEAPIVADRLEPFVEPSLCIAHLRSKDTDDEAGATVGVRSRPAR